ncbi:hypothetical protein V8C43DRAFT_294019 [Trichoderma afarasin]
MQNCLINNNRCKRPPPSLRRENSGTDRNKRCYTDQHRPDRKLPLRQGSRDEAKRPKDGV